MLCLQQIDITAGIISFHFILRSSRLTVMFPCRTLASGIELDPAGNKVFRLTTAKLDYTDSLGTHTSRGVGHWTAAGTGQGIQHRCCSSTSWSTSLSHAYTFCRGNVWQNGHTIAVFFGSSGHPNILITPDI